MLKRFSLEANKPSNDAAKMVLELVAIINKYKRRLHEKYEGNSSNSYYQKEIYKAGYTLGQALEYKDVLNKFNKGEIPNIEEYRKMLANGEKAVKRNLAAYKKKLVDLN